MFDDSCLKCPITQEILEEPVIGPDGYSYEKSAMAEWLQSSPSSIGSSVWRSPYTGEVFTDSSIRPDHTLKSVIEQLQTIGFDINQFDPSCLLCPISKVVIRDPVVAPDGYTYEREAMETWHELQRSKAGSSDYKWCSPRINKAYSGSEIVPARALKTVIDYYTQNTQPSSEVSRPDEGSSHREGSASSAAPVLSIPVECKLRCAVYTKNLDYLSELLSSNLLDEASKRVEFRSIILDSCDMDIFNRWQEAYPDSITRADFNVVLNNSLRIAILDQELERIISLASMDEVEIPAGMVKSIERAFAKHMQHCRNAMLPIPEVHKIGLSPLSVFAFIFMGTLTSLWVVGCAIILAEETADGAPAGAYIVLGLVLACIAWLIGLTILVENLQRFVINMRQGSSERSRVEEKNNQIEAQWKNITHKVCGLVNSLSERQDGLALQAEQIGNALADYLNGDGGIGVEHSQAPYIAKLAAVLASVLKNEEAQRRYDAIAARRFHSNTEDVVIECPPEGREGHANNRGQISMFNGIASVFSNCWNKVRPIRDDHVPLIAA